MAEPWSDEAPEPRMSLSRRFLSLPQELTGCSLPPKVSGRRLGSVCLCVTHVLDSAVASKPLPSVSLVRVRWWGEDAPGSLFRPSLLSDGARVPGAGESDAPQRAIAMRYPVSVAPATLLEYFQDMKQLSLDVIDRSSRKKYGQCSLSLEVAKDNAVMTAEEKLVMLRRDNALCEIQAIEDENEVLGYLTVTFDVQWGELEWSEYDQGGLSDITQGNESDVAASSKEGEFSNAALQSPISPLNLWQTAPMSELGDGVVGGGDDQPVATPRPTFVQSHLDADLPAVSNFTLSSPPTTKLRSFIPGHGKGLSSRVAVDPVSLNVNMNVSMETPKQELDVHVAHGDDVRIRRLLEKGKALQKSMEKAVEDNETSSIGHSGAPVVISGNFGSTESTLESGLLQLSKRSCSDQESDLVLSSISDGPHMHPIQQHSQDRDGLTLLKRSLHGTVDKTRTSSPKSQKPVRERRNVNLRSSETLQFAIIFDSASDVKIPGSSPAMLENSAHFVSKASPAKVDSDKSRENLAISLHYKVPSHFSIDPNLTQNKFERTVRRKLQTSRWLSYTSSLRADFSGSTHIFHPVFGTDAAKYCSNAFLIVEVWLHTTKQVDHTLLGLTKLPLNEFSNCFCVEGADLQRFCKQVLPFSGVDGVFPIENPFTGNTAGHLRVRVCVGTAEQLVSLSTVIWGVIKFQSVVRGAIYRMRFGLRQLYLIAGAKATKRTVTALSVGHKGDFSIHKGDINQMPLAVADTASLQSKETSEGDGFHVEDRPSLAVLPSPLKSPTGADEFDSTSENLSVTSSLVKTFEVCIQEGRDLVVKSDAESDATDENVPLVYATFQVLQGKSNLVPEMNGSAVKRTQPRSGIRPIWDHYTATAVEGVEWTDLALEVSVWQDCYIPDHISNSSEVPVTKVGRKCPVFIGKARVDLSLFACGWRTIDGWYHLLNGQHENQGQVKVGVRLLILKVDDATSPTAFNSDGKHHWNTHQTKHLPQAHQNAEHLILGSQREMTLGDAVQSVYKVSEEIKVRLDTFEALVAEDSGTKINSHSLHHDSNEFCDDTKKENIVLIEAKPERVSLSTCPDEPIVVEASTLSTTTGGDDTSADFGGVDSSFQLQNITEQSDPQGNSSPVSSMEIEHGVMTALVENDEVEHPLLTEDLACTKNKCEQDPEPEKATTSTFAEVPSTSSAISEGSNLAICYCANRCVAEAGNMQENAKALSLKGSKAGESVALGELEESIKSESLDGSILSGTNGVSESKDITLQHESSTDKGSIKSFSCGKLDITNGGKPSFASTGDIVDKTAAGTIEDKVCSSPVHSVAIVSSELADSIHDSDGDGRDPNATDHKIKNLGDHERLQLSDLASYADKAVQVDTSELDIYAMKATVQFADGTIILPDSEAPKDTTETSADPLNRDDCRQHGMEKLTVDVGCDPIRFDDALPVHDGTLAIDRDYDEDFAASLLALTGDTLAQDSAIPEEIRARESSKEHTSSHVQTSGSARDINEETIRGSPPADTVSTALQKEMLEVVHELLREIRATYSVKATATQTTIETSENNSIAVEDVTPKHLYVEPKEVVNVPDCSSPHLEKTQIAAAQTANTSPNSTNSDNRDPSAASADYAEVEQDSRSEYYPADAPDSHPVTKREQPVDVAAPPARHGELLSASFSNKMPTRQLTSLGQPEMKNDNQPFTHCLFPNVTVEKSMIPIPAYPSPLEAVETRSKSCSSHHEPSDMEKVTHSPAHSLFPHDSETERIARIMQGSLGYWFKDTFSSGDESSDDDGYF